eukprot:TRINITY_DN14376_c0_g1_i1.p2 TRINITY_DN14376_c0_g1~~TRINITY_DN14376_c0_g1_i1.p2  ORF type:complete len:53 (+),score=1.03 TRINITY_DN14376_c0_g1_i1:272-430(+)
MRQQSIHTHHPPTHIAVKIDIHGHTFEFRCSEILSDTDTALQTQFFEFFTQS